MFFSIRDDDTSYYTQPIDLIEAYSGLQNIPISISVIPNAFFRHADIYPYGREKIDQEYGMIGDNKQLIRYLKEEIEKSHFEILMHGIHHQYYYKDGWIPEMCYLSYKEIDEQITHMRKYLETIFNQEINIFVAPSNSMNKDTFRVLDEIGMDTMYILSKHFDHPFSFRYLLYYLCRNIKRIVKKTNYQGVLYYKNHKELMVYPLDKEDLIWNRYLECKKRKIPYIIYTHYWELNSSKEKKIMLENIVHKMLEDGARPCFISKHFDY